MTMLFALCLALAGTATFTACSADDPYFTVTEDDDPRILNTDLSDKTLDRKSNLKIEIRVTPMQYTTVTWLLNGVQIFEGATLDQTLPVGNHVLKIVATTTKGKSTSRTINVTVLPADGDPVLAADAKSRWLTVGATKTVACENVTSVSRVIVGDKEATNVSYADGHITFTVPTMDEGEYMLFIEDASGTRYGCGMFTVSNDAYVDPGIKETVLWEGATDINWGDSNVTITAETLAGVPVGATIRVCYEIIEAEYHALRITTPWWGDNAEDQVVAQFDLTAETPNPFEFTYTEANKAIVDERGGMLVVGFGYKLTKVIAVENAGPVENTLWEGATDINWGDSNVTITAETLAGVPVGATIRVCYEIIEAEYHALRITTPWWGDNAEDQVVAQFDLTAETPNPYVFTYTEANKAIVDERGGMLVVGFGYKLTRITYE